MENLILIIIFILVICIIYYHKYYLEQFQEQTLGTEEVRQNFLDAKEMLRKGLIDDKEST